MFRLICLSTILIFCVSGLLRAEEVSLSLEEALVIALRQNRDVLLRQQDIEKAKAKIKEAYASLLPSLDFLGGRSYTRGYYTKDISETTTHFSLQQNIYTGGRIINTIKYNEYGLDITQAILDKTKLELAAKVKKAFYTLILCEKLIQLNQEILANTQEHLDFLKARYQNGQAAQSELIEIEAALKNVQQAWESSLNQFDSAEAILRNLLSLEQDVKIRPDAELAYIPVEVAYDEAFVKALEQRPEIRQYEAQVKASEKAVSLAKSASRPNIYASWDYYSRSQALAGAGMEKNWNDYNVIGIVFSWPIFDGFATKQKVEQALIELKQAKILKEKSQEDIALELKEAYLSLKNAIAKISSYEADLQVYLDQLKSIEEKYKQGIASSLDLEDAKIRYAIALFNKDSGVYDYLIAKEEFQRATGGM